MTQIIFDIENEKDMEDLWNMLPESVNTITKATRIWLSNDQARFTTFAIKINWHDKKEIVRPMQEATEADIGKLCMFYDDINNEVSYAILEKIRTENCKFKYQNINSIYKHCRRLTKQEIEELC